MRRHSSYNTYSHTAFRGVNRTSSFISQQVNCSPSVVKFKEPMAHPLTNWNTGLFDCCDDLSSCCYGFWCCPCLACTVAGKFGDNRCLPLCDILSPAITAACGLPLCVPPAALALRVGIRHRYGIKGSLCKDIATSCFCEWCSWCQMHREMKYRKKNSAVIVNAQPPPVMMAPGNPHH